MSPSSCCPRCHFAFEEQYVLPFLPREHQGWILREHAFLREYRRINGAWPGGYIVRHAEKEDPIFGRYLPPDIFRRMEREHQLIAAKVSS